MNKPKIILHIGVHKTGSTAIQRFLWQHADSLREKGVLYPVAGRPIQQGIHFGHHFLPWFYEGRKVPNPIPALAEEIRNSDPQTVLLSSEEFDTLRDGQIKRFVQDISQIGNIEKIFFYYRQQSEVLQSLYGTDIVWNREVRSVLEYKESFRSEIDYYKLASIWSKLLRKTKIVVRPYKRGEFFMDSIIADFFKALELPELPQNGSGNEESNPSLPWFAAMTVQHMWRLGFPAPTIFATIPLLHKICRGENGTQSYLSPSQVVEFDRSFEESNRLFQSTFAPEQNTIGLQTETGIEDSKWHEERKGSYAAARLTLIKLQRFIVALEARTVNSQPNIEQD